MSPRPTTPTPPTTTAPRRSFLLIHLVIIAVWCASSSAMGYLYHQDPLRPIVLIACAIVTIIAAIGAARTTRELLGPVPVTGITQAIIMVGSVATVTGYLPHYQALALPVVVGVLTSIMALGTTLRH